MKEDKEVINAELKEQKAKNQDLESLIEKQNDKIKELKDALKVQKNKMDRIEATLSSIQSQQATPGTNTQVQAAPLLATHNNFGNVIQAPSPTIAAPALQHQTAPSSTTRLLIQHWLLHQPRSPATPSIQADTDETKPDPSLNGSPRNL